MSHDGCAFLSLLSTSMQGHKAIHLFGTVTTLAMHQLLHKGSWWHKAFFLCVKPTLRQVLCCSVCLLYARARVCGGAYRLRCVFSTHIVRVTRFLVLRPTPPRSIWVNQSCCRPTAPNTDCELCESCFPRAVCACLLGLSFTPFGMWIARCRTPCAREHLLWITCSSLCTSVLVITKVLTTWHINQPHNPTAPLHTCTQYISQSTTHTMHQPQYLGW